MSSASFTNTNTAFFITLRSRVNDYFKQNNLKYTGNFKLYAKTAILVLSMFACYTFLVFFTPSSTALALGVCAVMGVIMAAIGFNVMHDGAHGSYSENKTVNTLMTATLNLMGGSSFIWKQKHNVNHHSFTNIEGLDDDIDIQPFIRVNSSQPKYWFHKFQHIYSLFLYCFTYVFWIFYNDFKKYFSGKVSEHTKLKKMKRSEHIMFWFTKIAYTIAFLVVPMFVVGVLDTLVAYLVIGSVCGFVIALVFQLAHIYEASEFVAPQDGPIKVENDWAIHQINTTANFATQNKFVSWLWGGLNYQIEHHLFPKISHVHYPAVSKIVKDTCHEFNVFYKEFPTVLSAVRSHMVHIKQAGIS